MKTIIAGGRNYHLDYNDIERLKKLFISEIVSGGARGVDKQGETYGYLSEIPVKVFLADWNKYGKSAGPIRNKKNGRIC